MNNIANWCADSTDQAHDLILNVIPTDAMVGLGDLSTIRQLRVVENLKYRGDRVVNPFDIIKVQKDQKKCFKLLCWPSLIGANDKLL